MTPVVVIGGGPAGIAAACDLAGVGEPIVLFERAARLGGRTASFRFAGMDEEIDDGQHVLLGACTQTIDLLERIGQSRAVVFQPAMRVPIVWPGGGFVLRSTRLPGPLHLLPSLLSYAALPPMERIAALRAGLSLLWRHLPDDASFSAWLSSHGQHRGSMAALWEPIVRATLNGGCDQVAASAADTVFRQGLLRRRGARMGFFTRPLSAVFSSAVRYLEERGGKVRTRSGVRRIVVEGSAVRGVELQTGERVAARTIIAAVPPRDLLGLLPEPWREVPPFSVLPRIPVAPIVDLHLWLDRSIFAEPFVVAIRSPLQAVFDATRIHGESGPTHLVISQSAAASWLERSPEAVREDLVDALRGLFPDARGARVLGALVVRHPRATVLLAPGIDRFRPRVRTPVSGLLLAGDATQTGWPSTIEGAVRSGEAAARAAR